jgi:hypothetical protein
MTSHKTRKYYVRCLLEQMLVQINVNFLEHPTETYFTQAYIKLPRVIDFSNSNTASYVLWETSYQL